MSSNSVRVRFAADRCPASFGAAHKLLSTYGDIARLDVTLASATGIVLATYFDVRAADRLLAAFGHEHAEPFPAASYDFRAVTVSAETMMALPSSFGGFPSLGEVMGVSLEGQDMVIEYFDMRAAHAVLLSLPASKPRPQEGAAQEAAAPLFPELPWVRGESSLGGGSPSESPSGGGGSEHSDSPAEETGDEPLSPKASGRPSGQLPLSTGAAVDRAGKPARAKATAKDMAKFDIVADKITSGEDARTTVMMRNLPKACSREDVTELLARCGLGDRYSFFYMPFDKRRNAPCGFAFLNFHSPADVLALHGSSQTGLWRSLGAGAAHGMPPAVSYARLQGHEELVRHFSLSAITYDKDVRKRPQFVQADDAAHGGTGWSVDMEPRYVFPAGGPARRGGAAEVEWSLHGVVGA